MTRRSRPRRWFSHLWREWTIESRRPIAPVFAKPRPNEWSNARLTASWIGHSTVLINFYGVNLLTDPVFFARVGLRFAGLTIGPKRLTAPALSIRELPRIDLVILSHAHLDHFDLRTLRCFSKQTQVITAARTTDLLRWTRLRKITELKWNEQTTLRFPEGELNVRAIRVNHWGTRLRHDNYRGYNGYVLERNGRRIIFGGDTAFTDAFAELRAARNYNLAIMAIGAYEPWIRTHATPEQIVAMCDAAGVDYILPIHHQTFRLSYEPFREPIERLEKALRHSPERIALREIGETFVLPEAMP